MKTSFKNRKTKWILAIIAGTITMCVCASIYFFNNPKWWPYEHLVSDVDNNDLQAVKADLDHGINPNAFPNDGPALQNEEDLAALCVAASNGDIKMVNLLLDHGADPNICDGWDHYPLTAAVTNNHIDVMKVLIARGAHVNDEDGYSDSLWRASCDGKLDSIRFLLSHGANPNTSYRTDKQTSVLGVAKLFHQDAAARLLKQAGAKE